MKHYVHTCTTCWNGSGLTRIWVLNGSIYYVLYLHILRFYPGFYFVGQNVSCSSIWSSDFDKLICCYSLMAFAVALNGKIVVCYTHFASNFNSVQYISEQAWTPTMLYTNNGVNEYMNPVHLNTINKYNMLWTLHNEQDLHHEQLKNTIFILKMLITLENKLIQIWCSLKQMNKILTIDYSC